MTSRSTQPSSVGSLANSGLGAVAGVAAAAGEIEPVTSFAAAGAAAAATDATGATRSIHGPLSLASLAAGSACAFSTLSRRSLVLLNWAVWPGGMFDAGPERRDVGIDPRNSRFQRAVSCCRCTIAR